MEVLKQSRGHLKGAITRAHKFVVDLTDEVEVELLETHLERLEEIWKDFCLNQKQFFDFHGTEGYGDPEADFEVTETKYFVAKSALVKAIRKKSPSRSPNADNVDSEKIAKQQAALFESLLNKPTCSNTVQKTFSEIELPPFKIAPFSGDYREWPGFRDMFIGSIGCKGNLPGAQKLRYLKSFLREDAAKLLNHIEITDSNYELAWEKLENRYNKPLYIVNAYIESFLNIQPVTNTDSARLRSLTDNADEVIRGLKSIRSENRDPWVIYLLLHKADLETRKAWALANKHSEESTIQELLDFLETRCSALEASEPKPRSTSIKQPPRSGASRNLKSLTVSNLSCPKCKGNHSLPQCSQFLAMSITSRRVFVRDQRLCYNCLGNNHTSGKCRVETRCSNCKTRHHTLVHLDQVKQSAIEEPLETSNAENCDRNRPLSVLSNHFKDKGRSCGILPTVLVNIIDITGKPQQCRVLLDTGSQVSIVTEGLVKRLGLRRRHARVPISGISSQSAGVTNGVVALNLFSRFGSTQLKVEAYILKQITSKTPSVSFELNDCSLLDDIEIADPSFNKSGPIDVLLGSDKAWSILRDGRFIDDQENIVVQNTIFGWVITGNIPDNKIASLHISVSEDLDFLLKSFWEMEEVAFSPSVVKDQDIADKHFAATFSRAPDNKYVVKLPFKQANSKFGNTLSGALARLSAMERRFTRNEGLQIEYCRFMKTYLELGHMERIPDEKIEPTIGKVFYLPHHAVVTNKIRVVFDGSFKDSKGKSLNEMLHVGPALQRNLVDVCIRFRLHKYVFCADIVKMFRQIWVDASDRDYQRIVWRENSNAPVEHYWLNTVTYGTSPAPFLSMKVLKQLAADYQDQFPLASHSVLRDFYVDDILTGADSVSEVVRLKEELVKMLKCGGLELSKWSSNCWQLLTGTQSSDVVSLDLDSRNNCTKVLGLVWNPYHDKFTFRISLEDSPPCTKRKLLSEIAKIFDPLGFLSPSTILLKTLFQELWLYEGKIEWDDLLPKQVADKWTLYRQVLPQFEGIQIPRKCTLDSRQFDLIGFSDASERAYSAVVYMRSVSAGCVEVQLVAAKTRVAPVKQLSIPRLELCGALLLSRLIGLICSSIDAKPMHIFAFSDSKIVLAWLSSTPRRWNTFVANRTSEILDVLPRSVWNYVRSEENPADCASRGISPSSLLQLEIWWKGPIWIAKDFNHWPEFVENDLKEVPEEKKIISAVHVARPEDHFLNNLSSKVSSWNKILRIVAYLLRFVKNCRLPPNDRRKIFLSSSELSLSKQTCLLFIQEEFNEEKTALKSNGWVSNRSRLASLSPFIDEVGLLRVGGRIAYAEGVSFNIKHPIILPKTHNLTRLILLDAHFKFLHAGVTQLFVLVRQEFWIFGCKNLIRKIVFDCQQCFRLRQKTSEQLMGNLPTSRLTPSFAFDHTGCDYAGPITLRLSKCRKSKLEKGYIALFICMTTKAIHLEVVSDLSTDAFLAALRRFIARRGKCSVIHSDNGTNFQGAARILSEWFKLAQSKEHNERITNELAKDNIEWDFIPPHSPHFGGLWEAGVKCVKQHLRRVVGSSILTFEELSTLLCQIEALLNSRPLCSISDSDLNPLTPSHFLIGRPYSALPEPCWLETPTNRLGRWELVQNMVQGFWQRWKTDYLTSLQQRPKWKQQRPDPQVGDLVVLKEPNLPPAKWSLGRIEAVHPGRDGLVRVVSIRANNVVYKRPITKIALLPAS